MARLSAPVRSCPNCAAPLVHLQMGDDLLLRSCSRCDSRWWSRGDEPAELDEVLGVVAGSSGRRRVLQPV
jgi:Zn-finger nucleic acid-binding protein